MKKNYLLYFLLLALSTPIWVSCNDWTESEAKDYFEGPSEEYYAALRAYKKSDHPKAFGWFGNWTGEGASLVNSMAGIPDSVDVVSIWGNWSNITEAQKKDLKTLFRSVECGKAVALIVGKGVLGVNVPVDRLHAFLFHQQALKLRAEERVQRCLPERFLPCLNGLVLVAGSLVQPGLGGPQVGLVRLPL